MPPGMHTEIAQMPTRCSGQLERCCRQLRDRASVMRSRRGSVADHEHGTFIQESRCGAMHSACRARSPVLENSAKSLQQVPRRARCTSDKKLPRDAYVDFTVVTGYVQGLVLVAVLVVLGIAEAVLEGL